MLALLIDGFAGWWAAKNKRSRWSAALIAGILGAVGSVLSTLLMGEFFGSMFTGKELAARVVAAPFFHAPVAALLAVVLWRPQLGNNIKTVEKTRTQLQSKEPLLAERSTPADSRGPTGLSPHQYLDAERVNREATHLAAAALGVVHSLASFIETYGEHNSCPPEHHLHSMIETMVIGACIAQFAYTLSANKKLQDEQVFSLFHQKNVEGLVNPLAGLINAEAINPLYRQCFEKRYSEYLAHLIRIGASGDKQSALVLLTLYELYSKNLLNDRERSPSSLAIEEFLRIYFFTYEFVKRGVTLA